MGRKITVWIFQATNKRYLTRKNLDHGYERKNLKRETESLLKAEHKNQLCQCKNRQDATK